MAHGTTIEGGMVACLTIQSNLRVEQALADLTIPLTAGHSN
jgi:hypothetical protein